MESLRIKGFKKRNLLIRTFKDREEKFVARNLNDTKYASRALSTALAEYYNDVPDSSRRIFARPGSLTGMLRKSWGFKKDRSDDRHHALDALIVASVDEGLLNRMTRLYQKLELEGRGRETPSIPPPWAEFRSDALHAFENVAVSRSENRRARGKAHDDTIRQVREEDGQRIVYERKPVEKMTKKDLNNVKDAEQNAPLVKIVQDWLDAGKPKSNPPRFPNGDIIRKVRLRQGVKAGFDLSGGHVDNGDMVRSDVFSKDGKFFVIPIYRHQVADKKGYPNPPNRAIVAYKDEADWTPVNDFFTFKFSLYPDSYLEAVKRDGEIVEGYYRGVDRSTGAITLSPHHRREQLVRGLGTKTLVSFRKFEIDRLGRKHEIPRETRTWHGAVCT